ncbi:CobW family GTP-binding protein [Alishewanella longhuensis]
MQSTQHPVCLPVFLLTGFLGSGKTTLLNQLVKQPELARTLIIINEFGTVSLDHLLVSHANEEAIVELASGCLCCTIRGDLAKTLRDIHWRFSRQGERCFDRVIIETTGLAEPAPIIHTLMTDITLASKYRLQGVITTLDSLHAGETLDRHPEAQKQVAVADLLLLTKTDLLTTNSTALMQLQTRLTQLNPTASILITQHGELEPQTLLSLDHIEPQQSTLPLKQWLNTAAFSRTRLSGTANSLITGVSPQAAAAIQNDPNRHNNHIKAHCFTLERAITPGRLDGWLNILMRLMGANMLRVKGILNVVGHSGPVVIHGVQHIFHPAAFLTTWPDDDRQSKLVFITYDIERETLAHMIETFLL